MKNNSSKFLFVFLGLFSLGILPYFVMAATYIHPFTNTTNLVFTNSIDTHTMAPGCDGSSPTSYNWSLTVNGTSISGTHTCAPAIPLPVVTLTASPSTIDPGDSSTLTWTVSEATSCTASGGWAGAKAVGGGSEIVSPSVTTTYNLSCTGAGGTTEATPVTVTSPSGFISAGTCTIVPSGTTEGTGCDVTVNWNAYDFVGTPAVLQGVTSFSSNASGPQTRTVDPDDRSFTLRDTGGSFMDSATADVTCQTGTVWLASASHCAFLPIVGIDSETNLIRSGATLDYEVTVNSNFDLTCTVRDGGASQTFSHVASATTVLYPRTTRPLTSAQVVDVSCVSPLNPAVTGSDEVRINVIPTIQET